MCGRFTNQITWRELVDLYRIHDQPALNLRPRYNVAPSQDIPIGRPLDDGREIVIARWGLVPFWAKDLKVGYKMINAKEDVASHIRTLKLTYGRSRCEAGPKADGVGGRTSAIGC